MAEQEQKRAEQRIADGGPAFPPVHDPDTHAFGMTLRDYFAAKALPLAYQHQIVDKYHPESEFMLAGSHGDGGARDNFAATAVRRWIAEDAYLMADAMLAARSA